MLFVSMGTTGLLYGYFSDKYPQKMPALLLLASILLFGIAPALFWTNIPSQLYIIFLIIGASSAGITLLFPVNP